MLNVNICIVIALDTVSLILVCSNIKQLNQLNMKQIPSIIGWILLIIAFGAYLYGIYFAIFTPVNEADGKLSLPEPLDTLLTTLNAILLTNLGAVLGIAVTNQGSGLAGKMLLTKSITIPPPLNQRELIQLVAVLIYLVALVACFIDWAPFIPLAGKTLIGVITAYVAFILGK
jgi:hypothetical protein